MATYLDTSVIMTRYVPTDPNFHAVEDFFNRSSEAKYISEVSVLELCCVFSRLIRGGLLRVIRDVRDFDGLGVEQKARVALEHAIRSWRLRVATTERSYAKLPLSKQTVEVEHTFFEAIRISPMLGLKALDTLHLAYAHAIRETAVDLETFTTLDKDIQARREQIRNELGIRVVSPLGEV
jgi:predicted nucleic acid-binding protein